MKLSGTDFFTALMVSISLLNTVTAADSLASFNYGLKKHLFNQIFMPFLPPCS